jgi:hypothetical protein
LSKPGKHAHDLNVYLYRAFTVKHAGKHYDALFSKRKGQNLTLRLDAVTICDRIAFLFEATF